MDQPDWRRPLRSKPPTAREIARQLDSLQRSPTRRRFVVSSRQEPTEAPSAQAIPRPWTCDRCGGRTHDERAARMHSIQAECGGFPAPRCIGGCNTIFRQKRSDQAYCTTVCRKRAEQQERSRPIPPSPAT